ncbi:unnamed protein product [Soboliphyme baturini]|uniref:FERM domain-containing protein n=1 Tax=Soboliphyme baturini TaxID=241478 RepID=A0A183J7E0_9BILA|nr:unnamed protein product [Soboliphyme baturini]
MLLVPDNRYYWYLTEHETKFSCSSALKKFLNCTHVVNVPDGHPFLKLKTLPNGNALLYLRHSDQFVVSQAMALEMVWLTFSGIEDNFRTQLTEEVRASRYRQLVTHYHREFKKKYYGITRLLLRSAICVLDGLVILYLLNIPYVVSVKIHRTVNKRRFFEDSHDCMMKNVMLRSGLNFDVASLHPSVI